VLSPAALLSRRLPPRRPPCRAPKPAPGPHKQRECLPLSIILRNRLKYALTRKESLMIVMQKLVKVDGKVRTELNFPAGFMGACRCVAVVVAGDSAAASLPSLVLLLAAAVRASNAR
jgi:ribosomal protein S4E